MKVPEEAKCDDCGHVHSQGFSWMTWIEFCKRYWNDGSFQKAVAEGVQNKNAGGGNFPEQSVGKVFMQFLEIRQPARMLNFGDLSKAWRTNRLPKHMKSVPRITIPNTPQSGEEISINTKDRRQELFAFQDPSSSHRVAELVTMHGWEHKVEQMPTQLWEKQGEAMVHAKYMRQMKDTNTKVLHAGEKCPLTSLDGFIAKYGKQRGVKAKTHGAPRPQSSAGSGSGFSSEDGNDDIAQVDEVSADCARDTDCCSQASSDDKCSNDSKSLASAQRSLILTTAASIKNKESTASLQKGSSSLSFSLASTSKRAPSRMGSDDEGDLGSYTVIPLRKIQPFAWESQPTGDQLEQPIGTRTHRLRKPIQPTGDVADKSMVPVSG